MGLSVRSDASVASRVRLAGGGGQRSPSRKRLWPLSVRSILDKRDAEARCRAKKAGISFFSRACRSRVEPQGDSTKRSCVLKCPPKKSESRKGQKKTKNKQVLHRELADDCGLCSRPSTRTALRLIINISVFWVNANRSRRLVDHKRRGRNSRHCFHGQRRHSRNRSSKRGRKRNRKQVFNKSRGNGTFILFDHSS